MKVTIKFAGVEIGSVETQDDEPINPVDALTMWTEKYLEMKREQYQEEQKEIEKAMRRK